MVAQPSLIRQERGHALRVCRVWITLSLLVVVQAVLVLVAWEVLEVVVLVGLEPAAVFQYPLVRPTPLP